VIFRECRRVGFSSARALRIAAGRHVVGNALGIASVFPTFATVTRALAALFADRIAHGNTR
jgi:hypothetical protein